VPRKTTVRQVSIPFALTAALLVPTSLILGACAGGGGGGGSAVTPLSPPPPPPPPPPPSPPPPPPFPSAIAPASAFETAEYNRTGGLPVIGASSAYALGATGNGISIAVIDTGVGLNHEEFVGADITAYDVCATSACLGYDASGNSITQVRQPGDIDTEGHGTLVTGVIAAVRQDDYRTTIDEGASGVNIHGIAYESSVLDIRADAPGSCARTGEDEGCSYSDATLIRAIDYAIAQGVSVINMSLGGDIDADPSLENAVRRAAAAGVLVVISAGNDAEPAGTNDTGNPVAAKGATPTEPAYIAGEAASRGRVVAVGSISLDRVLSDFSNRAGTAAQDYYLLAPGENIVTTGLDDNVTSPERANCVGLQTQDCNDADDTGEYYRVAGTSFSAPYVAGALALLLDAFPNLKQNPELALQILLDTADDYVDNTPDAITGEVAGTGTDAVSGVGIINLVEAFRPQGQQTLSISNEEVSVAQTLAPSGGAFGDWATASGAFNGIVFTDDYGRGFKLDADKAGKSLPTQLRPSSRAVNMDMRADWAASESRAVAVGDLTLAWSTPRLQEDRLAPYQEEPVTNYQAAYRFTGGEVEFGRGGGLARLAPEVTLFNEPGIGNAYATGGNWARLSHVVGMGLTMDFFTATDEARSLTGVSVGRDARFWSFRAGISNASDDETALGGSLQQRFGETDQADMIAYSVEGEWNPLGRLTLSSGVEMASVDLPGVDVQGIWTSRWSLGATHPAGPGALSFVVAQPRRAETGAIRFVAPTAIDATGGLISGQVEAGLTPSGRQIDYESRYRFNLPGDWIGEASTALSTSPNHISGADAESVTWLAVSTKW